MTKIFLLDTCPPMRQDGIRKAYATKFGIVVVHLIRPPVRRGAIHNNESELVLIDAVSKENRGAVCVEVGRMLAP